MGELWRKPVRQVGGCCGGDGEHYPIEALALDRPAHLRGREPTDGCAQANAAVQSKGESVRESSQTAAKRPDPAARAFGPAECVDDQRALPGERAEGGKRIACRELSWIARVDTGAHHGGREATGAPAQTSFEKISERHVVAERLREEGFQERAANSGTRKQ